MIVTDIKKDVQTNGSWKITPFSIKATSKTFKTWSSDIYQNKVRAVIRELSCNAVDAHTVSGNIEPFKVHLPTHFEQWFSIRDYGYGLSEKNMEEVFIVFFDSTKTDTNNLIGSYGLGSKSPFSIAESFIVNSYQNGTKSSYSLFTDEQGLPQMASLMTCPTDEQDGLEIIVTTNRIEEFEREAVEVYRWFEKIPIINSTTVVTQISEAKLHYKITGDGFGFNLKNGTSKAIMGGVAYEIPYGHCTKLDSYINFEIGDLSVNPGRETLSLDDKTVNALKQKNQFLLDNFKKTIHDTIDAEETSFKKARKLHEIKIGTLGGFLTNLQSEELKVTFGIPRPSTKIVRYEYQNRKCTRHEYELLPIGQNERYFRFKPKFEQRIRKYVRENRTRIVVLTDEQINECKIDLDMIEDLENMPKVDRSGTSKRIKVLASSEGWGWRESELDINQEYVYVEVFRRKPVLYGRHQLTSIIDAAKSLNVNIPVLYGLTTAVKKKGKGVELSQYLKSNLKSVGKVLTKVPSHARLLSIVDDRFKAEPMEHNLYTLYVKCGIQIEHDDSLDLLSEKYVEQYPMIPHIINNDIPVEVVESYIQKIEA